MRFIAALSAILLLSACASTAPAPAASSGTRTPAPVETSSRIAQALSAAGRAEAPTQSDVERLLGTRCALLLVFAADARNAMRLAEAHPSARRAGEAAPTLNECAAEADAR
jgi:hypothetical protein